MSSDESPGARFGISVSIYDDVFVVGAELDGVIDSYSGKLFIHFIDLYRCTLLCLYTCMLLVI